MTKQLHTWLFYDGPLGVGIANELESGDWEFIDGGEHKHKVTRDDFARDFHPLDPFASDDDKSGQLPPIRPTVPMPSTPLDPIPISRGEEPSTWAVDDSGVRQTT